MLLIRLHAIVFKNLPSKGSPLLRGGRFWAELYCKKYNFPSICSKELASTYKDSTDTKKDQNMTPAHAICNFHGFEGTFWGKISPPPVPPPSIW